MVTQPGMAATFDYIQNAATDCNTTATDIDAMLASLKSYVIELEGQYKGMAANDFTTLMADYDTYARMLHDALVDIGSGLRGNYVNYTNTELANINSLRAVHGVIPGAPGADAMPNAATPVPGGNF